MIVSIPNRRGIYALILQVYQDLELTIGSLGSVKIEPGVYCYIGSARGFGGLRARIAHHFRRSKPRLWWHIDYLTTRTEVRILHVVYAESDQDLESQFAKTVNETHCWNPAIPRFGATDRRDYTHLFRCACNYDQCLEDIRGSIRRLGVEPQDLKVLHLDSVL